MAKFFFHAKLKKKIELPKNKYMIKFESIKSIFYSTYKYFVMRSINFNPEI